MYQVEEDMEAIWAAAAALPTDGIHSVFIYSHTHPEIEERPGPLDPLQRFTVPEYYNLYVGALAKTNLSSSPTHPLWVQHVFRAAHFDITEDESAGTPPEHSTLAYRVTGTAGPVPLQDLRLPRTIQILLLQLRASVCTRIPGSLHSTPLRNPASTAELY